MHRPKENSNLEKESEYYQTIARSFFRYRGPPFFLSPQEIARISSWEKNHYPLRIVMEGIRICFESQRKNPKRQKRRFSLLMCEPFVLKCYEMHKERQVGRKGKKKTREEQRRLAEREVKRFLSVRLPDLRYLEPIFLMALEQLVSPSCDERILDDFESRVDDMIFSKEAGQADSIRDSIQKEHPSLKSEELEKMMRLALVKSIRQRDKIPHLSLFYY